MKSLRAFRLPLLLAAALCAKPAWRPLFNGVDLAGWHIAGDKKMWVVSPQDSAILGRSDNGTTYAMVFTDKKDFDQFTVKYSYRLKAGCSGFFFRTLETGSAPYVAGCQAEAKFESGDLREFGSLYCFPIPEDWVSQTKDSFRKLAARYGAGGVNDQFQDVVMTVKKPYVYLNFNGHQAVGANAEEIAAGASKAWDYTGSNGKLAQNPGAFGLQIHEGQPHMDVAFKNIAILTGCGTPGPGYDGDFVAGLPEQPAVYESNGCPAGTRLSGSEGEAAPAFGRPIRSGRTLSIPILSPRAHTVEIISLSGRVIFSGSAPGSHVYQLSNPPEPGLYVARLKADHFSATRKLFIE
jgi:hypothetical protein